MTSVTRTDEDRVIEQLVIEGTSRLYEDSDFMPIRQSLYNVKTVIPDYDLDYAQSIIWCRPYALTDKACYFSENTPARIAGKKGSLPDETFLGALLAVATYAGEDLLQNIFCSRVTDFVDYGVYTCRFYVNGEWVEVITDTTIPCIRNEATDSITCAYGSSINKNEMWIPLAEKAYAKAVGSYEAIQKVKLHEVLMHLTGGSVQQLYLHATPNGHGDIHQPTKEVNLSIPGSLLKLFEKYLQSDTIVLAMPIDKSLYNDSGHANPDGDNEEKDDVSKSVDESILIKEQIKTLTFDEDQATFLTNRVYSVVATKDIYGFELVLLHNPWEESLNCWKGDWGNKAVDWDQYPEILQAIEDDPLIPWSRKSPNGYFWMTTRSFGEHFNSIYLCKLFPKEKFTYYCVKGEWLGKSSGGSCVSIRDKVKVAKDAAESRVVSIQKATTAVVIDGDASWFNNPQYRIHTINACTIFFSLIPISSSDNDGLQYASISVTESPKTLNTTINIWDGALCDIVAVDKVDNAGRQKGQEVSIWSFSIDPFHYYHVIPHTVRRGLDSAFVLRFHSSSPIIVEKIDPLYTRSFRGEWRKTVDMDTTGGPVHIIQTQPSDDKVAVELNKEILLKKKENTKWCQNPQYHLEVTNPYSKEELYIKVVLKRTDKPSNKNKADGPDKANTDVFLGLVISKADCLEDGSQQARKKQPRQNPMGELLPTKESSLKKKKSILSEDQEPTRNESGKTVLRKTSVLNDLFYVQSSFSHKTEACIFFPKVPRSWMPNGLILTPCLSSAGVKGTYELEIYASEVIALNQLPDTFSRSIAGEWTEATAGGSHLGVTNKKNPKFSMKFRNNTKNNAPGRVRITLTRHGSNWRQMCKKDTVGCMIGFYVYIQKQHELSLVCDATFVPDESVSTENAFALEQLAPDEEYVIIPSTFLEGKCGSFVLSIISEYEFSLHKT